MRSTTTTCTGAAVEAVTGKHSTFFLSDGRCVDPNNEAHVKFPTVSVSEAARYGFFSRDGQRVERALQGVPSVDWVLEQGVCCLDCHDAHEQPGPLLCPVRPAAKLVEAQTSNRHSCRMTPGHTSRSSRIESHSMMVERNAAHEHNTCHPQSHNANSICIRSGTSRSAAGANSVSEQSTRGLTSGHGLPTI